MAPDAEQLAAYKADLIINHGCNPQCHTCDQLSKEPGVAEQLEIALGELPEQLS